ncbi:MAG: hypothetical protein IT427_03770 [Pirellulales bacterium]|nr:hypothetical protein [Pirellulales bacterium]
MSRSALFLSVTLLGLASGCGRGDYDDKLDQAIHRAKNPPVEEKKGEANDAAPEGGNASGEATPMN